MAPHTRPRILIVGAGPTGLAVAAQLHRAGVPARVVEASTERSPRSKGIAIWPRTLEIMRDLGIADRAVARGLALKQGTLWSKGRPLTRFDLTDLDSRFGWGLVLPQYETESVLEQRLTELGGKVEKGVRCTGVRLSASGLPVVALDSSAGAETTEVDWLIGCDGPGSMVRTAAGIRMSGELERYGWVLADVRMRTELPPTGVNWFLHAAAVLHVLPMPDEQWRLTMTVGRQRPDPARWPAERIQSVLDQRSPIPLTLSTVDWVSGFRVHQGIARRFRRGHIILAGDAAHVHSPAGAQGVNAGLQDAANLGWKLARVASGEAPPSLLDSYDAERRPAAAITVLMANRATRGATLASPVARAGRDRIWSVASRRGIVQRVLPSAVAGVMQRYPAGLTPVSTPVLATRRLRATAGLVLGRIGLGSRLPDVPLADGSLWDLLAEGDATVLAWAGRGRAWDDVDGFTALHRAVRPATAVLVFDSPGAPADRVPDEPTWQVVPDFGGRIRRALSARPDTVLVVRPDRYVGARGSATVPTAVRAYLRAVGDGS